MSLLKNVSKGIKTVSDFILIYGPDGVGKSSFAAKFPAPIFIGAEKGSSQLDVSRVDSIKTISDVNNVLKELLVTSHSYKTVVIDSLDWIEPLITQYVCDESGAQNIEMALGGYGKGHVEALKYHRTLIDQLEKLRAEKDMAVVIVAHSEVKPFNDPTTNSTYDRYQLKLNTKAAALWREAVDAVFFANFEVATKTDPSKKTRAFGDGARFLYTDRRPAFDAKNRYSLPSRIALDFEEFKEAKKGRSIQSVESQVNELLTEIKDVELNKKVTEAIKNATGNVEKLIQIRNRMRAILTKA